MLHTVHVTIDENLFDLLHNAKFPKKERKKYSMNQISCVGNTCFVSERIHQSANLHQTLRDCVNEV